MFLTNQMSGSLFVIKRVRRADDSSIGALEKQRIHWKHFVDIKKVVATSISHQLHPTDLLLNKNPSTRASKCLQEISSFRFCLQVLSYQGRTCDRDSDDIMMWVSFTWNKMIVGLGTRRFPHTLESLWTNRIWSRLVKILNACFMKLMGKSDKRYVSWPFLFVSICWPLNAETLFRFRSTTLWYANWFFPPRSHRPRLLHFLQPSSVLRRIRIN